MIEYTLWDDINHIRIDRRVVQEVFVPLKSQKGRTGLVFGSTWVHVEIEVDLTVC